MGAVAAYNDAKRQGNGKKANTGKGGRQDACRYSEADHGGTKDDQHYLAN